jgi:hypothetical protein
MEHPPLEPDEREVLELLDPRSVDRYEQRHLAPLIRLEMGGFVECRGVLGYRVTAAGKERLDKMAE